MRQPDREQRVSAAFVALADTLVDDYDIIDLLDQLVAHTVALLAADAAGLMLADPHEQLRSSPTRATSQTAHARRKSTDPAKRQRTLRGHADLPLAARRADP